MEMSQAPDVFSFQSILDSDCKFMLWDRYGKSGRVYRFSTIFKIIIKCYLERLIDSHRRGKCHSWPNLAENITFQRNLYYRIKFREKPKRPEEGVEDFKEKDFADLVQLMNNCKDSCGLLAFPVEIQDFVRLLSSGNGKEAILHCALFEPKERIRYVFSFYKEMLKEGDDFAEAYKTLVSDDYMSRRIRGNFWDIFEGDAVLAECCSKMTVSGTTINPITNKREQFTNNLRELLTVVYKILKHCTRDEKEKYYCQSDLEWKFFCYFPFFINDLWKLWKWKEGQNEVHIE